MHRPEHIGSMSRQRPLAITLSHDDDLERRDFLNDQASDDASCDDVAA
jgi:hypothetical protein